MAYKALYRTYRPNNFDEVAGQKFIVRTLQNAVMQNKIAHAYLFCGPRGTGKTSIAKIFAKAVNCESDIEKPCLKCENCLTVSDGSHPDIVEIDAASNNGVEEVRSLIEKVKYAPIKGKYKIYIIDEVHMMSTGAFNALLKTIEEPPAHIIFILATTEPHKVIPTIISRCQRFDFTKIKASEIDDHIKLILTKENIKCEDEVIRIIAQLADGGMRDALSILDQCIAYAQNDIKVNHINEIYGITTIGEKLELFSFIYNKNVGCLLEKVKTMIEKGIDIKRLTFDLVEIMKDSVVYEYTKDETLLKALNKDEVGVINIKSISERLDMIDTLMESYDKYRFAANIGSYFEVCLLKMLGNNASPVEIKVPTYIATKNEEKEVVLEKDKDKNNEIGIADREIADNMIVSRETSINEEMPILEKTVLENIESTVNEEINDWEMEEVPIEIKKEEIFENTVEKVDVMNKSANALEDEFVLQLLVGANKPEKQKDLDYFQYIDQYTVEFQWAKPANTLKNTDIMASSEKYIILTVDNQAEANDINERDSHNEFKEFTKELLHTYKKVFAVPKDQGKRIVELFKERMINNTLPEPLIFEEQKENKIVEKEKTDVEVVLDLFGENNIVITEE